MNRPLRLLTPVALLIAALALGACGQTAKTSANDFKGEQRDVAKVIDRLQSAGRKRDASAICSDLLAPALVKRIEASSKSTCPSVLKDALNDTDSFDVKVEKVEITGDRAGATVTSSAGKDDRTDRLDLQKVGTAWKIAALGSVS
jgi:hypothetical protein